MFRLFIESMSVNIFFDEITSLSVLSSCDVIWCVEELVRFGLVGGWCEMCVRYGMLWYVWYFVVCDVKWL